MKYLEALLREAENPHTPTGSNRQNRQKPLLSVLSVPSSSVLSVPSSKDAGEKKQEKGEAFFRKHVPAAALAVYPDWRALLIRSSVLGCSVWVARTKEDAEVMAAEGEYGALVLDDILMQVGRTKEQAREALLAVLIPSRRAVQ